MAPNVPTTFGNPMYLCSIVNIPRFRRSKQKKTSCFTPQQATYRTQCAKQLRYSSLELFLGSICLGLGSLAGLHETKTGVLDLGFLGLLICQELLVGLLELRHLVLEIRLGFLQLLLVLGDLGLEILVGHSHEGFNLSLLLVIAEVNVGRAAHGLEVLVREGLEGIEVAAALVILQVGGVAVFDGGESFDIVGVADGLAFGSAVDIADKLGVTAGELLHQFVPIGLHFFAVPSPRGLELDENRLAGGFGVPILNGRIE